jgi:hypothetical protein
LDRAPRSRPTRGWTLEQLRDLNLKVLCNARQRVQGQVLKAAFHACNVVGGDIESFGDLGLSQSQVPPRFCDAEANLVSKVLGDGRCHPVTIMSITYN